MSRVASVNSLIDTATRPFIQFAVMVGVLVLALNRRLEIPRYDYWDVAYQSSFVVRDGSINLDALVHYLIEPFVDQIMAMPKLMILLSNHLAGEYVVQMEITVAWLLLVMGYLLLLATLDMPLSGWRQLGATDRRRMLVAGVLYWWPATLPSLTNNWFAIQYSLVLVCGLAAIRLYAHQPIRRAHAWGGSIFFLLGALSHATGILLGPALALWLALRRPIPVYTIIMLLAVSLLLVLTIWMRHESLPLASDEWSWSGTLKFFVRIGTPYFWEQAIFILVLLPLMTLAVGGYLKARETARDSAAFLLLLWAVSVWGATWLARYDVITHANPHYLRFFVLLYIALLVPLMARRWSTGKVGPVVAVVLAAIWMKGAFSGIELAGRYRQQNLAGYQSLIVDHGSSNDRTAYLYPADTSRLTDVILPRLVAYEPYGYRALFASPR